MYAYFQGKLAKKTPLELIIDVQGIGYRFYIPTNLFGKLPHVGEIVLLHASCVVRETSQTLYAFAHAEERDLFELLLTFSGIGPKTALSIVGHFELSDLEQVVLTGNSRRLTQVPGIGKKTAERLIIDLKGKLKVSSFPDSTTSSSKIQDALNALLHLGCSQTHAEQAVKRALDELTEECDLATLISASLKWSHSR